MLILLGGRTGREVSRWSGAQVGEEAISQDADLVFILEDLNRASISAPLRLDDL